MSDPDKPELKKANDNPWYCLATLNGEQPEGAQIWQMGLDLAEKNRLSWNHWTAGSLNDAQRQELEARGFTRDELKPHTAAEKSEFHRAFAIRMGRENAVPPGPTESADFSGIHFDRQVLFDGYLFPGYASFTDSKFSEYASFDSAVFYADADFRSATFAKDVIFRLAKFFKEARFRFVTFCGYGFFGSTSFLGRTTFGTSTFIGDAQFPSATFSNSADFSGTKFFADTDFINAEFRSNTVFAEARFGTNVPDFRGAKLHEATEWHGATWPPAPKDKDTAQEQVYAYERLKLEMERLKKHEAEQFFFRKELRAVRGVMRPGSGAWFLNLIYGAASDYGYSIKRPLMAQLILFIIGSLIFANTPDYAHACISVPRAVGLSFANLFSFLPVRREIMTNEMIQCLSSAAQIFGTVQSIAGVLLLFVLGLALRTRFRMR